VFRRLTDTPENQELVKKALEGMMMRTVVVIDPTHKLFGEVLDMCRPGIFGGGHGALQVWHSPKEQKRYPARGACFSCFQHRAGRFGFGPIQEIQNRRRSHTIR
jgi:hypothetical protein